LFRGWHHLSRHRNLAIDQRRRRVPILYPVETKNDAFAVLLAFRNLDPSPAAVLMQKIIAVFEDCFAWIRVRIHLDPALDSKQAAYPAEMDGLPQFVDQLAA
jgi:hypothetical protein